MISLPSAAVKDSLLCIRWKACQVYKDFKTVDQESFLGELHYCWGVWFLNVSLEHREI